MPQPSNATSDNRKTLALAKRGKAARQTKSKAMHRNHSTARKGTRNLSWWMSAGK